MVEAPVSLSSVWARQTLARLPPLPPELWTPLKPLTAEEGDNEEVEDSSNGGTWFCYWLGSCVSARTYVGKTNDLRRRWRQHNGHIAGGANATHTARPWEFFCVMAGLPTERAALQVEWRLHHARCGSRGGRHGRMDALNRLSCLKRFTRNQEMTTRDMRLTLYVADRLLSMLDANARDAYAAVLPLSTLRVDGLAPLAFMSPMPPPRPEKTVEKSAKLQSKRIVFSLVRR